MMLWLLLWMLLWLFLCWAVFIVTILVVCGPKTFFLYIFVFRRYCQQLMKPTRHWHWKKPERRNQNVLPFGTFRHKLFGKVHSLYKTLAALCIQRLFLTLSMCHRTFEKLEVRSPSELVWPFGVDMYTAKCKQFKFLSS